MIIVVGLVFVWVVKFWVGLYLLFVVYFVYLLIIYLVVSLMMIFFVILKNCGRRVSVVMRVSKKILFVVVLMFRFNMLSRVFWLVFFFDFISCIVLIEMMILKEVIRNGRNMVFSWSCLSDFIWLLSLKIFKICGLLNVVIFKVVVVRIEL